MRSSVRGFEVENVISLPVKLFLIDHKSVVEVLEMRLNDRLFTFKITGVGNNVPECVEMEFLLQSNVINVLTDSSTAPVVLFFTSCKLSGYKKLSSQEA